MWAIVRNLLMDLRTHVAAMALLVLFKFPWLETMNFSLSRELTSARIHLRFERYGDVGFLDEMFVECASLLLGSCEQISRTFQTASRSLGNEQLSARVCKWASR